MQSMRRTHQSSRGLASCYPRNMNTQIRMRELKEVFSSGHGEMAHALMVRLAVLYEDLRIELMATAEGSIPVLDSTDERYRRNYFLRRCTATMVEFAETIRLLNECYDFQPVKSGFDKSIRPYWDESVRFFQRHERLLKSVRNDIGGHFGLTAAQFAVNSLSPDAVGSIELRKDRTVRLHFVGELVATATLRHLHGSTNEQKFSRLLRIIVAGFRHATRSCHCVAFGYLWDRFGQ